MQPIRMQPIRMQPMQCQDARLTKRQQSKNVFQKTIARNQKRPLVTRKRYLGVKIMSIGLYPFEHICTQTLPQTHVLIFGTDPCRAMDSPRPKRDRSNDNFNRATKRLMKRCHQMSRRYDGDVYILVRRKFRHYEYNSANDPAFPPPSGDLVSLNIQLHLPLTVYRPERTQCPSGGRLQIMQEVKRGENS